VILTSNIILRNEQKEYQRLSKQMQTLNDQIADNRKLKQLILEKEARVARLQKAVSLVERLYETQSTIDDDSSRLDFSVTPRRAPPPPPRGRFLEFALLG
jgi:hypothetical protein